MIPDRLQYIKKNQYPYITSEMLNIDKGEKYTLDELSFIVENFSVSLKVILKTQFLTAEFCKEYILNDFYAVTELDNYITKEDIVEYQSHIKMNELE